MQLRIVSSMATRHLLSDLVSALPVAAGSRGVQPSIEVISMGGVDAAKRVAAGEPFDAVVLAAGAIERLIAEGHLLPGSRVDIVRSPMAVAIRTGEARPAVDTEDAVRDAVVSAPTIGYSTGPSGDHLMALFERWGIAGDVRNRLVQARPGIPVASLVASGEAAIGFQQLSELMNVDGVDVLGLLPGTIQGTTTFSGAVTRVSTLAAHVRDLLAFMASPDVVEIKRRHGMEPA
jgi:molybdate transport system substrate-binding protein